MIKKGFRTDLQVLIYNLHSCNKNIKKLKKDLLKANDNLEINSIKGNLKEYKAFKLDFLRKINNINKQNILRT